MSDGITNPFLFQRASGWKENALAATLQASMASKRGGAQ
tara:strand:- start:216 stop:332 length:117 start_codon:yes stop_codon:yes gene_type:complete